MLPEAVRDLRTAHPSARVRIRSGTKEEAFELVQSGGVDFAITPVSGHHASISCRCSLRAHFDHAEGSSFRAASAALAEGCRAISSDPSALSTQTRALLESQFRRLGVAYDIAVELDSMDLLERYVELGLGLAVGLRGAASTEARIPLGIVSLDRFLPSEIVGVVRNRARPLSDYADALIARLQAAGTMPSKVTRLSGNRR